MSLQLKTNFQLILSFLQNAAENDMKRECFICGRESYEFESQAKVRCHYALNSSNR